jgi:tetratricopeptide (TPR) repeat protein
MKKRIYIIMITCLLLQLVHAQTTNTRRWRRTENDSMQNALILYDEKNYVLALPIYEQLYKNHPKEDFLRFVYGRCALYRSDKHEEALICLRQVYAKNKKVDNIELDLAKAYHYNNNLDSAMIMVDKFLVNRKARTEDLPTANQLKKYITNAQYFTTHPSKAKITNLGSTINSPAEEYVPAISADESSLIFTYVGEKSKGGKMNSLMVADPYGEYREDVYVSHKENDGFSKPIPLDSINTNSHDGAISLSNDGQKLFVYRDNGDDHGDIYESRLVKDEFTPPIKLRGQVNSYSWDGHCSLSPDGKTLYFSSERFGGLGGRDIYRAKLQSDSTWGQVTNLGDSINTPYDDDAPFLHPDGMTLYYSSKGKNSMGGYDIFSATMDAKDSVFRVIKNMGFPINSTDDDIYFVLAANNKEGYYSSGKKGGLGLKDIYLVNPEFEEAKPALYLVKGKTTLDGQTVESAIQVVMTSKNNEVFGNFNSNDASGKYLMSLPAGQSYKLIASYKDFPKQEKELDATAIAGFNEKSIDFDFTTKKDTVIPVVVKKDTAVVVAKVEKLETRVIEKPLAKDNFVPRNRIQEKIMAFVEKYGDISAEGLEFKVQVGAYRNANNSPFSKMKNIGKVEQLLLQDGIVRITAGGAYSTIRAAWTHNKKLVNLGIADAFVTALYKGKRVLLEELVEMGIFK